MKSNLRAPRRWSGLLREAIRDYGDALCRASNNRHRDAMPVRRVRRQSIYAAHRRSAHSPQFGKKSARNRHAHHLCAFPQRDPNGREDKRSRFLYVGGSLANEMSNGFA